MYPQSFWDAYTGSDESSERARVAAKQIILTGPFYHSIYRAFSYQMQYWLLCTTI